MCEVCVQKGEGYYEGDAFIAYQTPEERWAEEDAREDSQA